MARDELIAMLVGAGAGYLIGSSGKVTEPSQCPECISAPLYNRTVADQTPTYDNYVDRRVFGGAVESHDYWHGFIGVGSNGHVYQIVSFHMYNQFHKVWLKDNTADIYLEERIDDPTQILWEYNGNLIKITSPFGVVTLDTATHESVVDIIIKGQRVHLDHIDRKAMFYNDRNVAVFVPNTYYLNGFELIGTVSGTLNSTITLGGFGDFERVNWNWMVQHIPDEKWIGFSTLDNKIRGVLYKQGLYVDGGIYINNVYFKPVVFTINTTTFQFTGGRIIPLSYDIHVQMESGDIIIFKNTVIGKSVFEYAHSFDVYINGVPSGSGYAWMEVSGLI